MDSSQTPFLDKNVEEDSPPSRHLVVPTQRKKTLNCWESSLDTHAAAHYLILPASEKKRSKTKLALSRLSFYFAAMSIYTFSDSMDSIALTAILKSNATKSVIPLYANLEVYLLSGICVGVLCSGILYDISRPASAPFCGAIFIIIGAFLNALNILWISKPGMWWLQVIRSVCGIGIGCLFVTAALFTANCGLHLALPKEVAITCFYYGAGAVTSIVMRILLQQAICGIQASDCSLNTLTWLWISDSLVLIIPAVAILFLVLRIWHDQSIRTQALHRHDVENNKSAERLRFSRNGNTMTTAIALPPPVPPWLKKPHKKTLRACLGAGLTWFMIDAFFYGGSMYSAVIRSKVNIDPYYLNGTNPFDVNPFERFAASNLEVALVVSCAYYTC